MRGAYLRSSIGKKQMMALTGLGWCAFVFAHMAGNLIYFMGPEHYNSYGHMITGGKLYYFMEAGLLATLLGHMFFAALVVIGNRKARPVGYAVSPQSGEKTAATFASRTMAYSGAVILVFIVLHLITFRFGTYYPFEFQAETIRDLHRLMTEVFQSFLYVGWYVFALAILCFHLQHALWSSVQTLGLIPRGREPAFRKLSYAFGIVVAVGFALNPIYIYLKG
jgi:succinate dehydrogenase / fumarate reductase, cytochrome b subunit